jgi:hypothetical protein
MLILRFSFHPTISAKTTAGLSFYNGFSKIAEATLISKTNIINIPDKKYSLDSVNW